MNELYANKEALAARHHFQLDKLVEAIESGPSWQPAKKSPRIIRTAQKRFEQVIDDPIIRELREVRRQLLAEAEGDLSKRPQPAHPETV
jgi:hypothetical protein